MKFRVNEFYKREKLPNYSEIVPTYSKIKETYVYNEKEELVKCSDLSSVNFADVVLVENLVVSGEKNIQKIADSYKSQSLDAILDKFGLDYVLNSTKGFSFSNDIVEHVDCDKLDTAMNFSKLCEEIRNKTGSNRTNYEIISNLKSIYTDYIKSLTPDSNENSKKKVEEKVNETL